jgi:hypothetical protein
MLERVRVVNGEMEIQSRILALAFSVHNHSRNACTAQRGKGTTVRGCMSHPYFKTDRSTKCLFSTESL